MSELMDNKQAEIKALIEIDEGEIQAMLEGINRCSERLKNLIEMKAPISMVKREINMIQYQALGVLGMYECWALLSFVYKKEAKTNGNDSK